MDFHDQQNLMYEARILAPAMQFNIRNDSMHFLKATFSGKIQIRCDINSLTLLRQRKKSGKYSSLPILWSDIRELKDNTLRNRTFRFRVANGSNLKVKILQGDTESLHQFFKQLPISVYAQECPDCGGWVKDSKCTSCYKNMHSVNRRTGLIRIGRGIILLLLMGVFIFLGSFLGKIVLSMILLLGLWGITDILKGLYNLISGAR